MRLFAGSAAAVCLLICGCGNEAAGALEDTAAKLGDVRSGDLSMKLVVSPSTEGSDLGFELDGPFQLPSRDGQLPEAALRYHQIAGAERGGVDFISTEQGAWIEVEGQAYELPPERVAGLEVGGTSGEGGPLDGLDVSAWTDDEQLEQGEPVAGDPTDRISGKVDVVAALNDAIATARELGGGAVVPGLAAIEGEDAERLRKAVRSSSLEVLTGKEDRLLRSLNLDLDFALDVPKDLAGGLGRLSGAKVAFDLRIEDPNGSVTVKEPTDVLPFSALPSG